MRVIIGALVELLAAIPSVVLGLWGILVLGPFVADHIEPPLQRAFGFLPIFSGKPSSSGIFIAGLVLAIMVVPIVASICRELFLSVPQELEEGALALGATRWEMVRGVVLSSSRPGIAAAIILGLGRAIGEAIAVTQVIGAGNSGIHASLFATGDTLASRIAGEFIGASSRLQIASLFYLAGILLVIGLLTNLLAQLIVRRFDVQRVRPADGRGRAPSRCAATRASGAAGSSTGWPRRRRRSQRWPRSRCSGSSSTRSPAAARAS